MPGSKLVRFDRSWGEMPPALRSAIAALLARAYLRLSYPTDAAFGAMFGVAPGTAAFALAWEGEISRRAEQHATFCRDDDWIYTIAAEASDGTLIALGTMMTAQGTGARSFASGIGQPTSTIPTSRLLRFVCPPDRNFPADLLAESDLAEFTRICILQRAELLVLVRSGHVTLEDAAYVEARGFDEVFALAYWRDQAHPAPPRAYLGNAKPMMIDALVRRDLDIRLLYLAEGAEPTAYARQRSHYFATWEEHSAPLSQSRSSGKGSPARSN